VSFCLFFRKRGGEMINLKEEDREAQ